MKRAIFILILSIVTFSCQKAEFVQTDKNVKAKKTVREYLNGHLVNKPIIVKDEDHFITIINEKKYPNSIFHFDNEKDFEEWAKKQDFGVNLVSLRHKMLKLREMAESSEIEYYNKHGKYSKEFQRYLDEITNTIHQNNNNTAARVGLVQLYDDIWFRNSLGIYVVPTPRLPRRARNKAESLEQIAFMVSYHTRTWWRGRALWLFNPQARESLWSFNNDIESIMFY